MRNTSIKLLHITTIPYALIYMAGQVGFMKARGLEVHGLSSPGALLAKFGEKEGIQVHAVTMERRITPFLDLLALFRIWRAFLSIRPDIVHGHTPKGGLLGMLGAWLARVPVRVYHIRGLTFMTASGWRRQLLVWCERVSCRLAHQVLCVSSSVRQVALDEGLCRPEKVAVLLGGSGNGVDATERFDPDRLPIGTRRDVRAQYGIPEDALVLGFIGRIVHSKGITELAEAWSSLREEFPSLHLLLVGPLEPQDPIPPKVEESLRRDRRVHLIGEEWNTPPLYAAMDLFVLPTYREGFPNVLLEAGAMRLPVVATRIPGCADAVNDKATGILVAPYDASALVRAISRYLRDSELRRRHGLAARERVLSQYRQEAIWQALYLEYLRLLGEQKVMPPPLDPVPSLSSHR
jgi:glycosyltransferase involved in cell wall biosynthesis